MKMYNKINKSKLFDGSEKELYETEFKFIVNNSEYIVKFTDFCDNPLKEMEDDTSFNTLIREGKFKLVDSIIVQYKSSENLDVYFFKHENIYFLFSFGEIQPSRFILYLEGIWIG